MKKKSSLKNQTFLQKFFGTILKHLYYGIMNLNEFTPLELLDLFSSVNEFMLPELMSFAEPHLLGLRLILSKLIYMLINLQSVRLFRSFVSKKWSDDFIDLSEEMLIDLLKRDDLDMEEVELWKYVIHWGIHKCSNNLSGKNVNEWNEENFKELWEIIKNPVELIRFNNISNKDFSNVVKSPMFPRYNLELQYV
ncbi:hypothetical protein C1645_737845 [Glomus cerebriforme]|uniref:BACK domain-containing protein n=1 Tax=Glomus cerebriforme TaxID=658196 RepID=A0A397SZH4_9GLOM|nr:hypothetical protein C1645_737845 [Glomus cerebriforme]